MSLSSKKIAILVGNLFEESEFQYPLYRLSGEGAKVTTFSPDGKAVRGKNGMAPLDVDKKLDDLKHDDFDAIVVPGGFGPDYVRQSKNALEQIQAANSQGKALAFICHGLWVGVSAGIVNGRKVTSVPVIRTEVENAGGNWIDEGAVVDNNLVTAQGPKDLEPWMKNLIDVLSK